MYTLALVVALLADHISHGNRERELSQRLDESWRQQALYEQQVRDLRNQLSELQNVFDQAHADSLSKLSLARKQNIGYLLMPFVLCSVREPNVARLECYDAAVAHRQTQMGTEVTRPIK